MLAEEIMEGGTAINLQSTAEKNWCHSTSINECCQSIIIINSRQKIATKYLIIIIIVIGLRSVSASEDVIEDPKLPTTNVVCWAAWEIK